jgi:hypothetical protein
VKATRARRNTFAAQLRNCRTVAERWRLVNFGNPQDVVGIVTRAIMLKGVELDTRESGRRTASDYRPKLEAEIGKLILSLVMAGNVAALRALVKEIELDLAEQIVPDKMTSGLVVWAKQPRAPQVIDRLRQALFAIGPGCYTWNQIETRLAAYHAGTHDRRHIKRTWQQLGLPIRILPAKAGRPKEYRTRKRTR